VLDGTMNLRDLGGWPTTSGSAVAYGQFYRSDRLSDLSPTDLRQLEDRGLTTVIDLRYAAEVHEHPSRLWTTVQHHHQIPMGGQLADQRSFIDRVLAGELDEVTDDDVAVSYIEMLTDHPAEFGQATEAMLAAGPALFHCTAGKDRTGLLAMLIMSSVGVDDQHILDDFDLSNRYRAARRVEQLRPTFETNGLDIERFVPALSAPVTAMERAMTWISSSHGSAEQYLGDAGVIEAGPRLRGRLLQH